MTHGLRLTGTPRDLALLRALTDAPTDVLHAPWVEITAPNQQGLVVTSPRLDETTARFLLARGVPMVRVRSTKTVAHFEPLDGSAPYDWKEATGRTTDALLEALRPVRTPGDPVVDEAIFWCAPGSVGATQLLERLLVLGRDDVTIAEVEDRGVRAMLVRVPRPPMYLLMRAREEAHEGVRAFARHPESDLWVEWGYEHPLPGLCVRWLANNTPAQAPTGKGAKGAPAVDPSASGPRTAFVEASGRWRYAASKWPERTIYDAIAPTLAAPRIELAPEPGETRHTVALRLGNGPDALPEVWLLSPEQFLALEALIESSTSEEVARFTVARMTSVEPGGTRYLLREIIRPNVPRIGMRIGDITSARGFARAPGVDTLFLPCGRRLLPSMRRDELRKLLGLDGVQTVILDEDTAGPRIYSLRSIDEVPLSRWVEYVATDRRVELDRLLETSVFELPEMVVEKPAREKPRVVEAPAPETEPRERAPREKPKPKKAEPVLVPDANSGPVVTEDDRALREEIRALETVIAEGGCDDGKTWSNLGRLKLRAGQFDEAAVCLEGALFHSDPAARDLNTVGLLANARKKILGAAGTKEELVELLVKPAPSPGELSYAGARVAEMVLSGDTHAETVAQAAVKTFGDANSPVSRRLAWLVLGLVHGRNRDALGLTRSKERVLGRINDRGLDENYDLPAFVRFALALDVGGDTESERMSLERSRGELLGILDDLMRRAQGKYLRELDSLSGYVRSTFAVGYTRLGVASRARDVVAPLELELSAHDAPNQVLYRLYLARMAHVATQGSPEAWKSTVDTTLAGIKENRTRDRVEWLRKRSIWLRTETAEETVPYIRGECERLIAGAEANPEAAADVVAGVFGLRQVYDYEVTQVLERAMKVALRAGSESLVQGVLAAAMPRLGQIAILGHRALALGVCIKGAAMLGDATALDQLLDAVIAVASAPQLPPVRDLLLAVHPGLAALRRVGATNSAGRLLEALTPIARKGGREGVRLQAALADGYLQLRETERADEMLDGVVNELLTAPLDNAGRYEGGVAVLDALKHWSIAGRAPRCVRMFESLDEFRDSYTMSSVYATHKVLLLERLVDAVTDEVTLRTDKVQGYLDREEQVIRRRILREWRETCGR